MSTDTQHRRAIVLVIDGLRADVLDTDWMPTLSQVASKARVFGRHRGVFPSATRVSSASIATGCWPGRHGLAGNAIASRRRGTEGGLGRASWVSGAVARQQGRQDLRSRSMLPTPGMVIHINSSQAQPTCKIGRLFDVLSSKWQRHVALLRMTVARRHARRTGDAITAARCYESLLTTRRQRSTLSGFASRTIQHTARLTGS